jgi:EmrB/QacA subfamily drug resistance transporter
VNRRVKGSGRIISQESNERHSRPSVLSSAVVVASLSAFLGALDSAVNISFPAITGAFSLEVSSIQWVIVGYVLPHASLLLGCGRLADVWGHGRVLTCGLLVSSVAFLGCGLAPSFSWLIAARVGQGVGAALISGSAPALVTLAVPPQARGRALGIYQMSMAAGYALGPLVGGVLVDLVGWRAVFLFRLIPAMLLIGLALAKLPALREPESPQGFDLLGALTFALSLASLLLAISQSRRGGWSSSNVITLGLFFVTCFSGFIVTERRVSAPVINLSLFAHPPFVIANLLAVLANCARFAIGLLVPYYVIEVLRYSATTGGTLMLAAAMMTPLAAPVAGRFSDRFGTAVLSALGLSLEGLGLWMVSRLDAQSEYFFVAVALCIVGLGLGVFETPNMSFVMGAIPRNQQGVAGSISNMMRTLGIVFGATGWSMLFDARREFYSKHASAGAATDFHGFVPAFQDVFVIVAALCAVAFGLSLLRRQKATES